MYLFDATFIGVSKIADDFWFSLCYTGSVKRVKATRETKRARMHDRQMVCSVQGTQCCQTTKPHRNRQSRSGNWVAFCYVVRRRVITAPLRDVVRRLFCAGSVWRGRFARNEWKNVTTGEVKKRKKQKRPLREYIILCSFVLLCQRYSIVSGESLCYTLVNRTDRNSVQQL